MSTPQQKVTVQKPLICSGHSRPVPFLAYSPKTEEGFFLISACLDGKPMLRDGVTGDWIGTFEGHKGAVWSAQLNSHATRAVTGSADYTAKVWNSLTGDELHSFEHKRIVKTVDFSPDGQHIVTGGQEELLRVFDMEKVEAEPQVMKGHNKPIRQALWGPDPNSIVSAAHDNIKVWDVRSGSVVRSLELEGIVTSIEISTNSDFITATVGKEVQFYDKKTFELQRRFKLGVELNSSSLNVNNGRFVAGGGDGWVRVHDFTTGKELEVHKGHHGPVHCIRFASDFETYASGSEDGTIRLWQTVIKTYGLWQMTGQEDKEGKETKEGEETNKSNNHSENQSN
jgi:serine-threonine kinase receptor-associated protein